MKKELQIDKNEKELRQLVDGDRAGASAIYAKNFERIRRMLIRSKGIKEEDIQDIFQEALVDLIRIVEKPDFVLKRSLFGLLCIICKRRWYRKAKKINNKESPLPEEANLQIIQIIDQVHDQSERTDLFREKLKLLSIRCQSLINLFFSEVSMEEIAKEIGIKGAKAAKTAKFRCKKKLFELVENDPRFQELKTS